MKDYLLALDQGTTSSRAIIFDKLGTIISSAQTEFEQIFPFEGWVEHDPIKIYNTQVSVAQKAIEKCGINPKQIAAIGITNQRETTIVWDRNTGNPIYNAIVWQCRRTAHICDDLKKLGLSDYIQKKTGMSKK